MRILIVEDDEQYARLLADCLERSGMGTDIETTVAGAGRAISRLEYAAIVVDCGLPDGDGIDLVRDLRSQGCATPVVIATARSALGDRLRGFDAGADDYLCKPLSSDELVARLHALLRRQGDLRGHVLSLGNVSIERDPWQLKVAGILVPVRLRELAILDILIRNKGTVVRRDALREELTTVFTHYDSNAIDVYVHRLRQRLSGVGATITIHTIRGVGFLISEACGAAGTGSCL
jgi:two-component system response regulator TctD